MTTVAMNNLWNYIQGLSLSSRNKEWLAKRLLEASQQTKDKDSAQMTKEEYFAKLERAEQQLAQGEGHAMLPDEDLTAFLKRRGYEL